MKKLTTLSILLISLVFVAPMQVSAIPIPPEPGPTSLSCEPSPLEIYHGDSAYFTVTITDNDSDDQIKIQNPKVRVSNTGEIKNKSRFSAKERESDNPESGDRTFEVSFTGGPVHDLNGTTEDTVTFEAIYQEASTKEGSLFVRDIKQSVSCLLVVTHSKKPTLTPSGGGIHPPEKSEDKNGQLRGSAGVKPGSFFYFFDTAFENIGLFFTFNPEKKAQKALEHADERLAEAEESAVENNPKAVEKAMAGYEEEISFATEKSKGLKDEKRAEELLNIVSENTTKHQEILEGVLEKVPEEAKQAILNAIEVSKKGQEEAAKQIAELKGEIDQLKKEVADLKKESSDSQASEVEKLKKEVEELKKKQNTVQSVPKQPATTTQNPQEQKKIEEKPKTTTTTLPNGAVVEMDVNGNIVRTIKEAPQQIHIAPVSTTQTQTPTAIQISSVNITPAITSAKIEWQTDKPTESKIFLSGGGLSSKVYNSESGLSTRHSVSIDGLSASTNYSYEIEAIVGDQVVKKQGSFATRPDEYAISIQPDKTSVPASGWHDISIKISALKNGLVQTNQKISMVTPDSSQNQLNNDWNTTFYYSPKTVGTHKLEFSWNGVIKSIDIQATLFIEVKPQTTITQTASIFTKGYTRATLATLSFGGLDDEAVSITQIKYNIVSADFTTGDIVLYFGDWGVSNSGIMTLSSELRVANGFTGYSAFKIDAPTKSGTLKIIITSIKGNGVSSGMTKEILQSPVTLDVTVQ